MNWTDDEVLDMIERANRLKPHDQHTLVRGGTPFVSAADYARAIATRAVELKAARGGILTADGVEDALDGILSMDDATSESHTANVRAHIAALGARIATLEFERSEYAQALYGYTEFHGPCAHGRDPWDRCDECGEDSAIRALLKVRAKLEQQVKTREAEIERLKAAGHVLSAYVDQKAGAHLGPHGVANLPNVEEDPRLMSVEAMSTVLERLTLAGFVREVDDISAHLRAIFRETEKRAAELGATVARARNGWRKEADEIQRLSDGWRKEAHERFCDREDMITEALEWAQKEGLSEHQRESLKRALEGA